VPDIGVLRLRQDGIQSKQSLFNRDDSKFQRNGIRTSIFVDPRLDMIEGAKETDRIELYTESLCASIALGNQNIEPYIAAAVLANDLGLGINAGHDLSLDNIQFLNKTFPVY
jgi:pyridoxine 5-phosphate synthase